MQYFLGKDEEKHLFEKLNEIENHLQLMTRIEIMKNYFLSLSEIKVFTDKFFDNVIVNDENHDIKKIID